jgi:hypothetical protein
VVAHRLLLGLPLTCLLQMMGAVVKRYFAAKLGKKPEDICLVSLAAS